MDFPTAWKASSVALTGAFGILGLLTEFKNKHTHKITRWGYISLAGILLSTVLGTTAQLIESANDQKKGAEDAKKALALAEKSDRTLTNIDRSLHPIEGATLSLEFSIPCGNDDFKGFCRDLVYDNKANKGKPVYAWGSFPDSIRTVVVDFRVDNTGSQGTFPDVSKYGNLVYELDGDGGNEGATSAAKVSATWDHGKVYLFMSDFQGKVVRNDGAITSMRDLHGATVVISDLWQDDFSGATLNNLVLTAKNGEKLLAGIGEPHLDARLIKGTHYYAFHFPKT